MTTGPGRTLMISPLTPKSSSTPSSSRAFCSSASLEILLDAFFGSASIGERRHGPFAARREGELQLRVGGARAPGFSGPAGAATRGGPGGAAGAGGAALARGA